MRQTRISFTPARTIPGFCRGWAETDFERQNRPTNKNLRRGRDMNQEDNYYEIEHGEIESSVLVLGAAYAASLLGMIFWVIT